MVWRNGTPCAHSEEKAQRNETPHTDQNTPKSKKSLQPIKRYFFVVPPTPKGAFALLFPLYFMVFLGRSPLKTYALFIAWSIICSIGLLVTPLYKGIENG